MKQSSFYYHIHKMEDGNYFKLMNFIRVIFNGEIRLKNYLMTQSLAN